jgi:hypothetical protein
VGGGGTGGEGATISAGQGQRALGVAFALSARSDRAAVLQQHLLAVDMGMAGNFRPATMRAARWLRMSSGYGGSCGSTSCAIRGRWAVPR